MYDPDDLALITKRQKPVITEDRGLQHNLLQQLNQFIWKVCCHESLYSNRNFLCILGL